MHNTKPPTSFNCPEMALITFMTLYRGAAKLYQTFTTPADNLPKPSIAPRLEAPPATQPLEKQAQSEGPSLTTIVGVALFAWTLYECFKSSKKIDRQVMVFDRPQAAPYAPMNMGLPSPVPANKTRQDAHEQLRLLRNRV